MIIEFCKSHLLNLAYPKLQSKSAFTLSAIVFTSLFSLNQVRSAAWLSKKCDFVQIPSSLLHLLFLQIHTMASVTTTATMNTHQQLVLISVAATVGVLVIGLVSVVVIIIAMVCLLKKYKRAALRGM